MEDKQGVLFSNLFRRPVAAVFDSPQSSSDGLTTAESLRRGLGTDRDGVLAARRAAAGQGRQTMAKLHGLRELLRQRVFSIACGYAETTPHLRRDPVFKLLAGRDPDRGRARLHSRPCAPTPRRDLLKRAIASCGDGERE